MDLAPPTAPASTPAPDFNWVYAAWIVSLGAALGSLFFGEVMKLPPCTLCWYQRLCLFPLPVVLAVGIGSRDPRLFSYAIPFSATGLLIAIYHNLLYWGVIPEKLSPCTQALSCRTKQIEWLGFITIPGMALAAFATITFCLLAYRRSRRRLGA